MSVPASVVPGRHEGRAAAAEGIRPGTAVTVRTPATSANLGPGFDSLGLALALYDEVEVEVTAGDGVEVRVEGEGAGAVPGDERHLVVRAIRAGLEYAGAGRPGLRLYCRNVIPHGRGLGSSASAVVAGLVAARGLLTEPAQLDDATLLRLATAFEGHPDNAAAALLGGFTISWSAGAPGPLDAAPTAVAPTAVAPSAVAPNAVAPSAVAPSAVAPTGVAPNASAVDGGSAARLVDGGSAAGAADGERPGVAGLPQARAVSVPVHPDVWVVACVPSRELATEVARRMLPAAVPHADAAFNAGRAALLVEALGRRPDLLSAATADRLHQCQRASAMPESARLVQALRGAGAAAVVSGAGPTVLVLGAGEQARQTVSGVLAEVLGDLSADLSTGAPGQFRASGAPGWRALSLTIDTVGARLVTERTGLR